MRSPVCESISVIKFIEPEGVKDLFKCHVVFFERYQILSGKAFFALYVLYGVLHTYCDHRHNGATIDYNQSVKPLIYNHRMWGLILCDARNWKIINIEHANRF